MREAVGGQGLGRYGHLACVVAVLAAGGCAEGGSQGFVRPHSVGMLVGGRVPRGA